MFSSGYRKYYIIPAARNQVLRGFFCFSQVIFTPETGLKQKNSGKYK